MKKVIKIIGLLLISGMFCVNGWSKPGEPDDPHEITNASVLAAIGTGIYGLGDSYILMNDIDLENWEEEGEEGKGWKPIGDRDKAFTGTFDGQSHIISNLTINKADEEYLGLFAVSDGNISNLRLENIDVSVSTDSVGGLVGKQEKRGNITNTYAAGNVSSEGDWVGGLVGNNLGCITNSYATSNVSGGYGVGGLAGSFKGGCITNSYATGNVSGRWNVGGLVGDQEVGNITNSYATGNVSGKDNVGGLVGQEGFEAAVTITNSYATGDVSAKTGGAGGLVGGQYSGNTKNSYATGNVSGNRYVGGLVGDQEGGNITNTYAAGNVSSEGDWVGGLVGGQYISGGTITNSYWDTENHRPAHIRGRRNRQNHRRNDATGHL